MRLVYFLIGTISLIMGVIGVVLPVLPTTPFLLLSLYCYARSSKPFENWLRTTKMYQFYVGDYAETKTIARKRKKQIIWQIYILMALSIVFAPLWWVKIGLFCLTVFITYYLFVVIPDKEEEVHILLLGDSLFARKEGKKIPHINYTLKQKRKDLRITNRAVSGNNTFDLLALIHKEPPQPVDYIFVLIGANDLAQHKQVFLGEYQENLRKILEFLTPIVPAERIFLLAPPLVDETKQEYRTNRLVTYYTEVMQQVAEEYGCPFQSLKVQFEADGQPVDLLLKGVLDDGLHFGSLGYEVVADTMLTFIPEKT